MGLLDKIYGKKNSGSKKEPKIEPTINDLPKEFVRRLGVEDGYLSSEFEDDTYQKGKFYDTTKVLVNPTPMVVRGTKIYEIKVSWYGQSDAQMFIDGEIHGGRRDRFTTVYAGIDLDRFQNDETYFKFAARALLEENRVQRYLNMAMKTTEEIQQEVARTGSKSIYPCGRYIGNIIDRGAGLGKGFNGDIGKIFHNLPEMRKEREDLKMFQKRAKEAEIAKKQDEISRLSQEIAELKGNDER